MTKLTQAELETLAVIVRKCHKDKILTPRELIELSKVADCIIAGNLEPLKKKKK